MNAPLLHLATTAEWRAHLAAGAIAPPSLDAVGFVHLSTPEQVALPADRLFHGRADMLLLVLDPARIGVPVRYEPGVPGDPAAMRFPHAYGPVPVAAVLAVLPYRPRPDGGFDAPAPPPVDAAGRVAALERSLPRRLAAAEFPMTGGVAVHTADGRVQVVVDGEVDAARLVTDAERAFDGATRRGVLLVGAHLRDTAAALADRGWHVAERVGMAAPANAEPVRRAERIERAEAIGLLPERDVVAETALDVRYLGVREDGRCVAAAALGIDGGTAVLAALVIEPAHRGRGLGHALLRSAAALAAKTGCDLVALTVPAAGPAMAWCARRGCTALTRSWTAVPPS